jgi:hypothetical protein
MNDVLPDKAGYVAAAYLVFLLLVLVYVGIMAIRVGRLERELVELSELAERRPAPSEADREANVS